MPMIQHYTVVQVREVKVSANSAVDAVRIADAAFTNGQNSGDDVINGPEGVWGNTDNRVRVVSISARRE